MLSKSILLGLNSVNSLTYSTFRHNTLNVEHSTLHTLTLKGPGFFVYLKSGGGGRPPPSDLGRGATKNSEIWHVRRVSQYERADEIAILKIKAFLNYANLFLIITDKMRPFGAFKLF